MARNEQGTGIRISRLSVILIVAVIIVWALCGVLIFSLSISNNDPATDPIRFVQEFYNSEESEDACVSVPVIGDDITTSSMLNSTCKSAHEDFKLKYPEVSAVYVITYTYNSDNAGTIDDEIDDTYTYKFKVIAVDVEGNTIENLSKIVLPCKAYKNPYYYQSKNGDTTSTNGEEKIRFFPDFVNIEYGIYDDGSDS